MPCSPPRQELLPVQFPQVVLTSVSVLSQLPTTGTKQKATLWQANDHSHERSATCECRSHAPYKDTYS
jgi:hypothetical protein